ncbi:MAG TPA: ferritin-like domain-containing protein [Solirubrobacterales bacterium]|nr:ferritin-like domain-containing protein [Solirubrobacterales bacterium]
MSRNQTTPAPELPRRRQRLVVALALGAALALAGSGCGGGGEESPSEAEKADDIAILNTALGYELAAVDAYTRALPLLRGEAFDTARRFRAQEQEHVDAITKALRGLGGRADPEEVEFDPASPKTRADALTLAYDQVSAAIAEDMSAVAGLTATWPRALLTSIAANEAQQLAVLRQALGADPVPEAFENGEIPPPGTG